ncbi:oligosaccharide flippase family protein [Virgibacillus halophilus]|uniref:Oligosaccharide flippase family protein n=1 Tax=Tigheibacillus halophilus TaxID=361280 RepID=A0ABU5CE42_9BACI|nr:oligosaccharide flippase family protein [Virgibacillus halophilus]
MSKQTFLQGTLILIFAGMITRFLGFINRLVVARLMGEEGVGLYMMALPTLFLIMSMTQLGLPVAISKRVAEAEAKNDQAKIKKNSNRLFNHHRLFQSDIHHTHADWSTIYC